MKTATNFNVTSWKLALLLSTTTLATPFFAACTAAEDTLLGDIAELSSSEGALACETAFAVGATTLDSLPDPNDPGKLLTKRWGWQLGPIAAGDAYTTDIYAGAAHNDLSKGTLVGALSYNYAANADATCSVAVSYEAAAGSAFTETHLYVGHGDVETAAPGQFGHQHLLDSVTLDHYVIGLDSCDDIYIVAHAVACTGDGPGPAPTPDPECGNGLVEAGEQCDDGNTHDGDGCSATCTTEPAPPVCGDGVVEGGEQCDDGNTHDGDGCDADCKTEPAPPVCGDGVVEGDEQCDDGNDCDGDGCDANCEIESVCGDGIVEGYEQCDDGNTCDGDGCDADCEIESVCGDGIVEGYEQCDDGNTHNGDGCDATCTTEPASPVCGDGYVEGDEECDDGNTADGDGCSATCDTEPTTCPDSALGYCPPAPLACGNGLLDKGEECDDSNASDGDGCSAACIVEVPECDPYADEDCITVRGGGCSAAGNSGGTSALLMLLAVMMVAPLRRRRSGANG